MSILWLIVKDHALNMTFTSLESLESGVTSAQLKEKFLMKSYLDFVVRCTI